MNFKNVLTILKKELLHFCRNVETILIMILMPLVLYPVILLFTSKILESKFANKVSTEINVKLFMVATKIDAPTNAIKQLQNLLNNDLISNNQLSFGKVVLHPYKIINSPPVLESKNDINIIIHPKEVIQEKLIGEIQIYLDSRNEVSYYLSNEIKKIIKKYNMQIIEIKFREKDIPPQLLSSFTLRDLVNEAPEDHIAVKYGGGALAIIMIFLTYICCQYAATEVLPAEREQQTLETLLSTPLKWSEIIMGKYLAVAIAGLFNAILNLCSIIFYGNSIIAGLSLNAVEGMVNFELTPSKVAGVLLILIPLSLLCSSFSLLLISFAKSRMSASYYSLPGLLSVSIPCFIALFENSELTGIWYSIPFANIVLYFRNIFTSEITFWQTLGIFVNVLNLSIILTIVCIYISRLKDQTIEGGFSLNLFYRPIEKDSHLKIAEVIILVGSGVIINFFSTMLLMNLMGIYGIAVSFIVTLFLPSFIYLKYKNIQINDYLGINAPLIPHLLSPIFLLIPTFIVINILVLLFSEYVIDIKTSNVEFAQQMGQIIHNHHLFTCIFIFAIIPSITEEYCFRGLLYGSLIKKLSPFATILITGFLFSIAHGFSRSIAILPLGILLGFLRFRSSSIFPCILFHIIFNSTSILSMKYQIYTTQIQSNLDSNSNQIAYLALAYVVLALIGTGLLLPKKKHES